MRKPGQAEAMSAVLYLTQSVLENRKSKDQKDQKNDIWSKHAAWLQTAATSQRLNPSITAADINSWETQKEHFKQGVFQELSQPKSQSTPQTTSSVSTSRSYNPHLLVNQPLNKSPHSHGNKSITQEEYDYIKFSY